jgi:DNA-binding MarR family transcriptional regulator
LSTDNILGEITVAKSSVPQTAPLAEALVQKMSRFGSLYVQWVRSQMPETEGMTLPRLTLLGLLAGKGERVMMTELSELMGVSPRNITVLVDGLEREGFVRRLPHERDRRVTLVEITTSGKQVAQQMMAPHQAAVGQLFQDLSTVDQKQLHELLEKLLAALAQRGVGSVGVRG